jgi:hypothetical protein
MAVLLPAEATPGREDGWDEPDASKALESAKRQDLNP